MKTKSRWLILLAMVFFIGFTSCDDDEKSINKDKIIGTWECVAFDKWEKEDGKIVNKEDSKAYIGRYITIKADGTYSGNFYNDSYYDRGYGWYWEKDWLWVHHSDGDVDPVVYGPVVLLNGSSLVFELNESEKEGGVKYEYHSKVSFERISKAGMGK
jgi:hypothetical protein